MHLSGQALSCHFFELEEDGEKTSKKLENLSILDENSDMSTPIWSQLESPHISQSFQTWQQFHGLTKVDPEMLTLAEDPVPWKWESTHAIADLEICRKTCDHHQVRGGWPPPHVTY